MYEEYEEIDVPISDIERLLEEGVDFDINTPDGWQKAIAFVDKGEMDIYHLMNDRGEEVKCAGRHKFDTNFGWQTAEDMVDWFGIKVLCDDGFYHPCRVVRAGYKQKVVDISINHPNHRYFTNRISSKNTNVGKSAYMCHYAAEMVSQGYNVLYVSMEMAEEKLGTRIDANLMDVAMDSVLAMSELEFMKNINLLKTKVGKLIIKEFPTASVHMGHVEAMIRELKNKKGFVPDVVCLDYLGICLSRRVGLGAGTYLFVKAITEEFRGLAVKYNFVGVTATQGTRSTIEASDMNMSDTGDSKGINDTVDFLMGMMAPEEIAKAGLMLCKQLKSRYDDVNRKKRFVMTFDRQKMHFEEATDPGVAAGFLGQTVDNSTAPGVIDEDKPLFDASTGDRYLGERVKGTLTGISF